MPRRESQSDAADERVVSSSEERGVCSNVGQDIP